MIKIWLYNANICWIQFFSIIYRMFPLLEKSHIRWYGPTIHAIALGILPISCKCTLQFIRLHNKKNYWSHLCVDIERSCICKWILSCNEIDTSNQYHNNKNVLVLLKQSAESLSLSLSHSLCVFFNCSVNWNVSVLEAIFYYILI